MSVRTTKFGGIPWSDGQVLYSADLNDTFGAVPKILGTDSSTALSAVVASGSNDTDTGTYEFTAFTVAEIAGYNYLKIDLAGYGVCTYKENEGSDSWGSSVRIKIETKEIGGSYSDSLANTYLYRATSSTYLNNGTQSLNPTGFTYAHELTAGEKNNGVQVKVTITSSISFNGGSGSSGRAEYNHIFSSITGYN